MHTQYQRKILLISHLFLRYIQKHSIIFARVMFLFHSRELWFFYVSWSISTFIFSYMTIPTPRVVLCNEVLTPVIWSWYVFISVNYVYIILWKHLKYIVCDRDEFKRISCRQNWLFAIWCKSPEQWDNVRPWSIVFN